MGFGWAQEIDDMLAGNLSAQDDEELLAELDAIEASEAAAIGAALPDAPGVCGRCKLAARLSQP